MALCCEMYCRIRSELVECKFGAQAIISDVFCMLIFQMTASREQHGQWESHELWSQRSWARTPAFPVSTSVKWKQCIPSQHTTQRWCRWKVLDGELASSYDCSPGTRPRGKERFHVGELSPYSKFRSSSETLFLLEPFCMELTTCFMCLPSQTPYTNIKKFFMSQGH